MNGIQEVVGSIPIISTSRILRQQRLRIFYMHKDREDSLCAVLPLLECIRLFEISLQKAFECLSVTGFISGHLVDCVVDGVKIQFLRFLCKLEFA